MTRTLLIFLAVVFGTSAILAQDAFINEFDYDQPGGDSGEFVEIAIDLTSCGGACLPSDFTVELYNQGTLYDTDPIGSVVGMDGAYSLFVINYPSNGLQNGSDDGIALVYQGTVLELISYEGTFVANSGSASGQTSTDVGVSENGSAPNLSVQRKPDGSYETAAPTQGAPNNTPLPVTLTAFTAEAATSGVTLAWDVATQRDNDFFAVEHSRNGTDFSEVTRVQGEGTTEVARSYSYTFRTDDAGAHYFRLRQMDYDGTANLSDVVLVELDVVAESLQVRNAGVAGYVQVTAATPGEIAIVSMTGEVVARHLMQSTSATLNISTLPRGIYLVTDGQVSRRIVR